MPNVTSELRDFYQQYPYLEGDTTTTAPKVAFNLWRRWFDVLQFWVRNSTYVPCEQRDIVAVGAWTGNHSLRNPEHDADAAHALGLTDIKLMVADHSGWRKEHEFSLYSRIENALAFARLLRDRGIRLTLTSWIMPHEKYIRGAAQELISLANDCLAIGIEFDAEEPWTKAKKPMPLNEAAELIAELFAPARIPLGSTGIGYVSKGGKYAQLAKRLDYTCCQAYGLGKKYGGKPAPEYFWDRYSRFFGLPCEIGCAAWPHGKVKTQKQLLDAMHRDFNSAWLTGSTAVFYWSLVHIMNNSGARTAIKAITDKQKEASYVAPTPG